MKQLLKSGSIIVLLFCLAIGAVAQTASSDDSVAPWRITEKEVAAVQTELTKRGYYKAKPTGVLDRETREAVRAYQTQMTEKGLKVTGRIDRPTYESLGLAYPATGKERDSDRRRGVLSQIGYGVKDTTDAAGKAVTGTATKVKEGTVTGIDKSKDASGAAVAKTKETAQGVGNATMRGARTVKRGTQTASDTVVGRSDADVQLDVREVLEKNEETKRWFSDVKAGLVTIKTPSEHKADIGQIVSDIRKIAGVKSVFVVAE